MAFPSLSLGGFSLGELVVDEWTQACLRGMDFRDVRFLSPTPSFDDSWLIFT